MKQKYLFMSFCKNKTAYTTKIETKTAGMTQLIFWMKLTCFLPRP